MATQPSVPAGPDVPDVPVVPVVPVEGTAGHTGGVHEERGRWLEAERRSMVAEERRPDVLLGTVGALVTTIPLIVGVTSGNRSVGLFCALGGMNVALAIPSGTRVTRRRWGTVALLGSGSGVALATAVSPSVWLTVVATLVWVSLWCLVRGMGVPAVGVGFVTCAVFIIVTGQPAHLGTLVPRTAAYLIGGAVSLALCVAVVPPTPGATTPDRLMEPGALRRLATTRAPVRAYAVRAGVMVAAATLVERLLHVPDGAWIPLAVVAVLQPDAATGRTRALQRAMGTGAGVVLAAALITTVRSDAVLLVCILVTSAGLFALKSRNYFWMVTLLTPLVLLMLTVVDGHGLRMVGYRVVDTLAGTALAVAALEICDQREATGTDAGDPPS